jgi:flavin-dependent dehydrogenase
VTSPHRAVDVLVVGLGPAGSATAIRLAEASVGVLAVDRAHFPREKICSEYLSPETARQLDLLGVLESLLPEAMPLDGAKVIGPRGSEMTGLFREATPAPPRAAGLSLPRRVLDHVLVRRAANVGAEIAEGTSLIAIEPGPLGQRAMLRRGEAHETVDARLVIGADGLRSRLAATLGGRARRWLRRWGFVAHVAEVRGMGSVAEMHVGVAGYVGLNLVAPGITNVAVVVPERRAALAGGDPERFWFEALERFPGVRGRVDRTRIVREVMVTGPFAARSRRVIGDGVALVGDAADFFDPFTGEGVCAALRGASLLAPVAIAALAGTGPVRRTALEPYRLARRDAFAGKWAVERMIGHAMASPALFDRAVGRLGQRGLSHTLIGVTGDFLPASRVLRPGFLAAMVV